MSVESPPAPASGLAGPESVAWRVNAEIVVLLGWGRAILMQIAHPLVAAAIADHSGFLRDPHGRSRRLHQTLRAMLGLTFGNGDEVARAAHHINTVHDRIHGRLADPTAAFPVGTPYSAHDPHLLRWVHATLIETFLLVYQLYVGPLTPEEQDRYCREATGLEPLLGMAPLPASVAELRVYLDGMLAGSEIEITPTARRLAEAILWPPLPRPVRPGWRWLQLPAIGLLPPELRAAYGLAWDGRLDRRLARSAAVVRRIVPLLPPRLRQWPAAHHARRRFEAGRPGVV